MNCRQKRDGTMIIIEYFAVDPDKGELEFQYPKWDDKEIERIQQLTRELVTQNGV